jgi:hypothetical protein
VEWKLRHVIFQWECGSTSSQFCKPTLKHARNLERKKITNRFRSEVTHPGQDQQNLSGRSISNGETLQTLRKDYEAVFTSYRVLVELFPHVGKLDSKPGFNFLAAFVKVHLDPAAGSALSVVR